MGEIVAAMATCHAPQLFTYPPDEDHAQLDATIAAMRQLGTILVQTNPDVLIFLGSDHLETFSMSCVPAFALVAGSRAVAEFGKYFTLNANYTYSHILDNGNFTTFINLPQNQFDNKSEHANSNKDVRHRFTANFRAAAPDKSFLRNFTFSSIITIQSGRPFTLFTGGDSNRDTNPVTDRVGLVGRNTYIGDPMRAWDLRLSRFFQIKERTRLELIFDAFNALNRPNVDEVFSVYGSPIPCGALPEHHKDKASSAVQGGQSPCPAFTPPPGVVVPAQFFVPPAPNPNFGTPRTMLNPRQLQFAAKLTF
jgi:hypothetical protein